MQVVIWLRAFLLWLAEARLTWIALFVLVSALIVSFRPSASEFQIRFTGLILQWLGIGTVAYGIRQIRQLFGRPGILKLFWGWISRFPPWPRHMVSATGTGAIESRMASVRGFGWSEIDPTAAIDERVDALTKNVERLYRLLIQAQTDIDKELRKHSDTLSHEQETRAKDDIHLRLRLEAAETGGLHVSLIGVLWLLLGVFLSTVSGEIAQWVK